MLRKRFGGYMTFRKSRSKYYKSIYILPNLFTTLSLFFGFYAILAAVDGRFVMAAWGILISSVCDALDGTVARMTRATSAFGAEYDSLCDLVAFGVAPAILAYFWALSPDQLSLLAPYHEKLGGVVAFIFLACGALRLARFNVFLGVRDPGFFQGLPIPGGAAVIAACVLWHNRLGVPLAPSGPWILLLVFCLAFLMVSNLDYASHKSKFFSRSNRPFEMLVLIILLFTVVAIKIKTTLFPLLFIYLASGPLVTIYRRHKSSKNKDVLM